MTKEGMVMKGKITVKESWKGYSEKLLNVSCAVHMRN